MNKIRDVFIPKSNLFFPTFSNAVISVKLNGVFTFNSFTEMEKYVKDAILIKLLERDILAHQIIISSITFNNTDNSMVIHYDY